MGGHWGGRDGNRVEEGEDLGDQGWDLWGTTTHAPRGDWVTSRRAFLVEWWDAGPTTGG